MYQGVAATSGLLPFCLELANCTGRVMMYVTE